jgi:hypothetical protein
MRKLLVPVLLFLLTFPMLARGRSGGYSSRSHSSARAYRSHSSGNHRYRGATVRRSRPSSAIRCIGCERNSHGRIARSAHAKQAFRNTHPCPLTGRRSGACPGYQIDHVTPLYKGGADAAGNMQWLTTAQHKAKHRKR